MTEAKSVYPMEGLEIRKNPKNGFLVFQLHYTADPEKRDPEYIKSIKEAMPTRQFKQEYDLIWDSFSGLPVFADWGLDVHGVKSNITPQLGSPLLLGFDWGLCYSDDTEVLTDNGWKLFKDCLAEDRFATLNPESREIEYHNAAFRTEYHHKGRMLEWASNSVNFCVTPEHIVPFSKRDTPQFIRWASADTLSKEMSSHRYVHLTAKTWNGSLTVENPMGWDGITYSQFMGMYLSEGSIDKKYNRVSITQIKPAPEFEEVLNKTGLKWTRDKVCWRTSNKTLADHLRPFGTQEKRYVPANIKMASRPYISEFLALYTQGDGYIRHRDGHGEEHWIYTCSSRMAGDLQDLALKMGWTSSATIEPPANSFFKKENRIIKGNGGFRIRFKKDLHRAELLPEHFSEIDYDGQIYCVSVPHHTLYVRRNGRPSWNGNTPACIVCQMQEDTLCALVEFTAVHMGAERFVNWVVPQLKTRFHQWQSAANDYLVFVDPAGFQRAQSDESTCVQVIETAGFKNIIPGAIAWEERRLAVESFLTRRTRNGPCFRVSVPNCPKLVRGFQGGYRYDDDVLEKEPSKLRPYKNQFSHVHDALQMVASKILMTKPAIIQDIPTQSYMWNTGLDNNESGLYL